MCHDCGMYRSTDLHGHLFVPVDENMEAQVCGGCLSLRDEADEDRAHYEMGLTP